MANRSGPNLDLNFNFKPLDKGLKVFDDRLDRAIKGLFLHRRDIAQGWMKQNAPWTDQTGNARASLRGVTEFEPKKRYTLWLIGGMPYSIWLEVRFGGRYAVIIPAMIDQGEKLMKSLNKVIGRLGGGASR